MKLLYSIYKEYKVLIRDKAGLAILFLMPVVLILVMTLIQDSTFKSVNESSVPVLVVDNDQDSLSLKLKRYLQQSNFFKLTDTVLSYQDAKQEILKGHYLIGIIIPTHTSKQLKEQSSEKISNLLSSFSGDSNLIQTEATSKSIPLQLLFDPITKQSFKTTITNSIERIISQIELETMMSALHKNMLEIYPDAKPAPISNQAIISIKEEYATSNNNSIIPNSVQHNVPAWTLFAMFFICIPLASNIIKERNDGSAFRLMTMPNAYFIVMLGKVTTYLIVSLLQFFLILSIGVYILPLLSIPALNIGNQLPLLILVALSAGIAAVGFGLLVGTVATTHDQASLFGAIMVIIFAAIGGVWVPTFVMPHFMKIISVFSPMNWGLESFYAVFVRNSTLQEIYFELIKLWVFCAITIISAFGYQSYKRNQ